MTGLVLATARSHSLQALGWIQDPDQLLPAALLLLPEELARPLHLLLPVVLDLVARVADDLDHPQRRVQVQLALQRRGAQLCLGAGVIGVGI